jgi:hypothetical protein
MPLEDVNAVASCGPHVAAPTPPASATAYPTGHLGQPVATLGAEYRPTGHVDAWHSSFTSTVSPRSNRMEGDHPGSGNADQLVVYVLAPLRILSRQSWATTGVTPPTSLRTRCSTLGCTTVCWDNAGVRVSDMYVGDDDQPEHVDVWYVGAAPAGEKHSAYSTVGCGALACTCSLNGQLRFSVSASRGSLAQEVHATELPRGQPGGKLLWYFTHTLVPKWLLQAAPLTEPYTPVTVLDTQRRQHVASPHAYVFKSHARQRTAPCTGEKNPGSHRGHCAWPVTLAYRPAAHLLQPVAPGVGAYLPSAHARHTTLPRVDVKVPGLHV